ncbi:hypothetical protein BGX30_001083 [Mortierella sp. GBA39]|nr:hypothetical protein BGX30_001083 [Mortierella sp. GBA39]
MPCGYKRLLVGQSNVLPGFDRRQRGMQPHAAYHCRYYRIGVRAGRYLHQPFISIENFRTRRNLRLHLFSQFFGRDRNLLRSELMNLPEQQLHVRPGRKPFDLKMLRMLRYDIQRLRADRAGRAENA